MIYSKPCLHLISAIDAEAHCVNGSTPGAGHECSNGDAFSVGDCSSGAAAHAVCNDGNAAGAECTVGAQFGLDCTTGGTP